MRIESVVRSWQEPQKPAKVQLEIGVKHHLRPETVVGQGQPGRSTEPGVNSTIASYNASSVKIYNAKNYMSYYVHNILK
jgi:hypothetical protein